MKRPPVKPFYVLSQVRGTDGALRWHVVDNGATQDAVEASAEQRTEFAEGLRDAEIDRARAEAGILDPDAPDPDGFEPRHVLFVAYSAAEVREAGLAHLIEGPLTDTKGTIR